MWAESKPSLVFPIGTYAKNNFCRHAKSGLILRLNQMRAKPELKPKQRVAIIGGDE
jgi:hypothetical protein